MSSSSSSTPHLLIVESPYYTEISAGLAEGAEDYLSGEGVTFERVSVPGALEIPAAIGMAASGHRHFDGGRRVSRHPLGGWAV